MRWEQFVEFAGHVGGGRYKRSYVCGSTGNSNQDGFSLEL